MTTRLDNHLSSTPDIARTLRTYKALLLGYSLLVVGILAAVFATRLGVSDELANVTRGIGYILVKFYRTLRVCYCSP